MVGEEVENKEVNERIKPERQTEIILWDWLKTRSETVKRIFFNSKNEISAMTFTVRGTQKKPDLLVEIDRGYGLEYIAVEVKTSEDSRAIHDANKIQDYYMDYVTKRTTYYIDNITIKINHFAIATENSLKGFLFEGEDKLAIKDNTTESESHRIVSASYGLIPKKEYSRTCDFVRSLWSSWRRSCKVNLDNEKPSIGIIISNPRADPNPYLFTMIYVDWLKDKKSKWGQRFLRL